MTQTFESAADLRNHYNSIRLKLFPASKDRFGDKAFTAPPAPPEVTEIVVPKVNPLLQVKKESTHMAPPPIMDPNAKIDPQIATLIADLPTTPDAVVVELLRRLRTLSPRPHGGFIQRVVAHTFGVPFYELIGERRTGWIIYPRHAAIFLIKELTPLSYPQIGMLFGKRDHTTVMHAYRKMFKKLHHGQTLDVYAQSPGLLSHPDDGCPATAAASEAA